MPTKFSQFPAAAALDGTETVPGLQAGANVQISVDSIAARSSGGGGTMSGATYAARLCALLEPDAIEALQRDAFTYNVGANTKYVLASWATKIGAAGRGEVRNPRQPLALKNSTLTGLQAGACAMILDPSIPVYADAWTTYYTRKLAIDNADVRTISIPANSQRAPFLPGAYGAIITQVTCFDLPWIVLRWGDTWGLNLADEISDSATQRVGNGLCLPVSKRVAGDVASGTVGAGLGSVSYVLLPSTWSVVPDPISANYTFRDDFMGAALDPGVWTIGQSTAGNVGIDTKYQWCKLFGNAAWSGNVLFRTAPEARGAGTAMVVDVATPSDDSSQGMGCVGWTLGGATANYSATRFAHGVNFGGAHGIQVYEDGVNRGLVGTGWSPHVVYRVRITLNADGSAKYEIQGGTQYPPVGGAAWTDITPATSASVNNTLYPGAAAYAGSGYISDVRVY